MPRLPDVVLWSIPAFLLLAVIEMVSYCVHPDEDAAGYAGLLWACRAVHHSSRNFNLSTALRQPWTSLTGWRPAAESGTAPAPPLPRAGNPSYPRM